MSDLRVAFLLSASRRFASYTRLMKLRPSIAHVCHRPTLAAKAALALSSFAFSIAASSQTPGDWQYTISTDMKSVPDDMRINFPTVSFNVCRSAADFESGRAFALQTLASSEARCPSTKFERSQTSASAGAQRVSFEFSCDGGKTLNGSAVGTVSAKRFEFAMTTRYPQAVSGVTDLQQTMRARYVGPCKSKSDQDELKVP